MTKFDSLKTFKKRHKRRRRSHLKNPSLRARVFGDPKDAPILTKGLRRRREEDGFVAVSMQDFRNRKREKNRLAEKRAKESIRYARIAAKREASDGVPGDRSGEGRGNSESSS